MADDFRTWRTDQGVARRNATGRDSGLSHDILKAKLRGARRAVARLISQLADGHSPCSDGKDSRRAPSNLVQSLSLLTGKEREVLLLFIELLDNKEIAQRLGTKDQTVRNQLGSIMHKLAIESREELIAFVLVNVPFPLARKK